MKVTDLLKLENVSLLNQSNALDKEIISAYTSDLLSDVMGNADEDMAWITMQTHKNVIAIASLKELTCIIITNGNKPAEDMIEAANNENIPVLSTQLSSFQISGILYQMLNK